MAYIIEINRDECIGCGACVSACPDNFEIDDDGKSKAINETVDDLGCCKEAEDICPVRCIKVIEA